jgi:uncharacterized protein (TIGR03118 family)
MGYIVVFNTDGTVARRFASAGNLDAPWGMTVAPAGFGSFGGALLVGNNGDGRINAYNLSTGAFLGTINDQNGSPIVLDRLFGLAFGSGANANTLYFASNPNDGDIGLLGSITAR